MAELATRRAEKLVRDEGLTTLPIDPKAFAAAHGIEVTAKPADAKGVSGMLISVPGTNNFVIAYATHISNEGFQRFSIAHELGHYFLDGHLDHLLGTSDIHHSRAGFGSGDKYELQADHFAAGLLMPTQLFVPVMERAGLGFQAIETLRTECVASITATAIRYAQLCEEPVAIIVSSGSRIDYWFASDTFKYSGFTWPRKGDPLSLKTATAEFNKDPQRVATATKWQQSATIRDWFGDGPDREIAEDVVGLGSYGKTLTVLFAEHSWPDEEDEEDEELGAWNPTLGRSRSRVF